MVTRKIRNNVFKDKNNYKKIIDFNKVHGFEKGDKKIKIIEDSKVLYVSYYRNSDTQIKLYLNDLKKYVGLLECFLAGIPLVFEDVGETSRGNFLNSLRNGLCNYLKFNKCEHYSLNELDANFWNGFITWISEVDEFGVQIYAFGTQVHWCSSIRTLLRALCRIDQFKEAAKKSYSEFPKGRRSQSSKGTPRARLTNQDTRMIVDAAAKEFLVLRKRIMEGRKLIEEGDCYNKSSGKNYDANSYSSILAYLKQIYSGVFPRRGDARETYPELMAVIDKKYHGLSSFASFSYIAPRDCVASILLLAFTFALNPETVLTLDFADIQEMEILGKNIVVIQGEKRRSGNPQIFPVSRDFEVYPEISIGDILDFHSLVNKRLINAVSSVHAQRVFLFCNKSKAVEPRSFGRRSSAVHVLACTDIAFTRNLKEFIKDNNLTDFSLAQVRPTVLDEVLVNTGDIKIAQALGQQKNPWTLLNHYTSDGTKKRLEEKLGYAGFILRERWWRSEGVIDPRSSKLGKGGAASAATPGFYCFDAFYSPRPGQKKFRICDAYGECPACTLSAASDDVADVASYLALHERLIGAMSEHSEATWSSR